MLKPALLVLTAMADGDTRLTLSYAESAEECEAKRAVVTQILTEAGMAPLRTLCGETELQLTPYEHGAAPTAETHRYRVEIPSVGGFAITPLAEGDDCAPAPDADPAIYCTRSGQQETGGS
ncbi:MAG: hypothetical protein ACK5LJ_02100 [Paracoccus sp. (in: a-proteobacteria)]